MKMVIYQKNSTDTKVLLNFLFNFSSPKLGLLDSTSDIAEKRHISLFQISKLPFQ